MQASHNISASGSTTCVPSICSCLQATQLNAQTPATAYSIQPIWRAALVTQLAHSAWSNMRQPPPLTHLLCEAWQKQCMWGPAISSQTVCMAWTMLNASHRLEP